MYTNQKKTIKTKIYFIKLIDKTNLRVYKIKARSNRLAFKKFVEKYFNEIQDHNYSIKIIEVIDTKPTKPTTWHTININAINNLVQPTKSKP